MVTDNTGSISHYDAAKALSIAGGVPATRDHVVNSILELFAEGGELAALCEVSLYRRDPLKSRALTHRAIGFAQQGAMPSLELLCTQINTAINAEEFAAAEELGSKLPPTVESIRAAVLAEEQ